MTRGAEISKLKSRNSIAKIKLQADDTENAWKEDVMITREDVAKLAGVSVSTVSRVLNERGYVSQEKRAVVWSAVEQLGYQTASLSRGKKGNRQLCLILSQSLHNGYCVELFEYMAEHAQTRGYTLLLTGDLNIWQIQSIAADGIIVENERMAVKVQSALKKRNKIPVVSVSNGLPVVQTKHIPYIDVDGYQVMEMAVQYLKKKGHKKIAYAVPDVLAKGERIQPRSIAYKNMMLQELDKKKFENYLITSQKEGVRILENRNCFEEGERGAEEFARKECDATAVICYNDEYALGMIYRLEKLGYKVPQDVSVIGIDGLKKGNHFVPRLTSVSINTKMQACSCVDVVIDMIKGRKVGRFISIKPQIIERDSVRNLIQV